MKSIHILSTISRLLQKDFTNVTKKDIEKVFAIIENSSYAGWTKYDFQVVTKRFYKWLIGNDEEYPDCIKWLKAKEPKNNTLPEQLVTPEEVEILINGTDTPRDRALISVLYESGARISELLNMKIKSVEFAENGLTKVMLDGKTGPRKVPLVKSTEHLKTWLSFHPLRENSAAPLWPKLILKQEQSRARDDAITYEAARNMLKKIYTKTRTLKPANPHLLRHSRATFLAKHLTEAQLKQFFGWTQSSTMAARYVHLSGRDLDGVIFNIPK